MLTDAQIAKNSQMLPIKEVAENAGLDPEKLEFYGKYKAKLSDREKAKTESLCLSRR